jgi:O-antigen ligase
VTSRSRRLTPAASFVLAASLLLVAWGAFAFGAVYPWAYMPLALGAALTGLLGLTTGTRPAWPANRPLFVAFAAVFMVAGVQLIPLPFGLLGRVSPATVAFLQQYDFRYASPIDPSDGSAVALRHAISLAPDRTMLFVALFAAPLLLFSGLLRTLSRTGAMRIARGIVFIGLVLALFAIVQKALLGDGAYSGMKIYGFWQPEFLLTTPYGPFVNKNHFAGWMLMGVPLALGLAMAGASGTSGGRQRDAASWLVWLSEPGGGKFLYYLVAALIMALSLVMAGSRSGLAAFAIAVCGAAAWLFRRRSPRAALGAVVAAIALIVAVLQWAGGDAALHRFSSDTNSLAMRLDIWRISTGIVRSFPLVGTGLNTFGVAMLVYQPPAESHYNEAHNDYLQLLVEGGVITLVVVLVAIVAAALAIRSRFRAGDDGGEARWVRAGATTGLVAIALQSLVEFSLQMPGNAALFSVLLALALYIPTPIARTRRV